MCRGCGEDKLHLWDIKLAKNSLKLRLADATLEIQLTQQIENAGGSAITAAVVLSCKKF